MTDNLNCPENRHPLSENTTTQQGLVSESRTPPTLYEKKKNRNGGRRNGHSNVSEFEKGQISALAGSGMSPYSIALLIDRGYSTVLNNIALIKESQPLLAAGKMVSEAAPLAALRVVQVIGDEDHPDSYKASKDLLKGVGIYKEQSDVNVKTVSDDQINASIADKILQALTAQAVDADVVVDPPRFPPPIYNEGDDDAPKLQYKSMGEMIQAGNERRAAAKQAASSTPTDTDSTEHTQ